MSKRLDALGDRLKDYEKRETGETFIKGVPVYARIDGRGFSKFTKNMKRPFDDCFSLIMVEVTKYLVQETNACTGYTQSDEISLGWYEPDLKSDIFFGYKKQKMVSTLSALATAKFLELAMKMFPEECSKRLPTFDARVFSVPNEMELMNCFLWRVQDAVKNSVSMATRSVFSHKDMMGKNTNEMKDMLLTKGINWNSYPRPFKEGSFIKRTNYLKLCGDKEVVRTKVIIDVNSFEKFKELSTEDRVKYVIKNKLDEA